MHLKHQIFIAIFTFDYFLISAGIQIVGMSATIGNLRELAHFLNADVYNKDFRPVELTEHLKCGSDILQIQKNAPDIESSFVSVRTVDFSVRTIAAKYESIAYDWSFSI